MENLRLFTKLKKSSIRKLCFKQVMMSPRVTSLFNISCQLELSYGNYLYDHFSLFAKLVKEYAKHAKLFVKDKIFMPFCQVCTVLLGT